ILDVKTDCAPLGTDDNLFLTSEVNKRGRSVSNSIVEGAPEQFAIALVKAENRLPVSRTALNDKLVANNQRRRRNSVSRHISMIFNHDIAIPNGLAGFGIEAPQLAYCAKDVEFAVVVSGCEAQTFLAEIFLKVVRPCASPHFTPHVEVVS